MGEDKINKKGTEKKAEVSDHEHNKDEESCPCCSDAGSGHCCCGEE